MSSDEVFESFIGMQEHTTHKTDETSEGTDLLKLEGKVRRIWVMPAT